MLPFPSWCGGVRDSSIYSDRVGEEYNGWMLVVAWGRGLNGLVGVGLCAMF